MAMNDKTSGLSLFNACVLIACAAMYMAFALRFIRAVVAQDLEHGLANLAACGILAVLSIAAARSISRS